MSRADMIRLNSQRVWVTVKPTWRLQAGCGRGWVPVLVRSCQPHYLVTTGARCSEPWRKQREANQYPTPC